MKRKQRQKEKAGQGQKAFNRHLLLAIANKKYYFWNFLFLFLILFLFLFLFFQIFFDVFFHMSCCCRSNLLLLFVALNKNVWMKCLCDDVVVKFNIGKRLQIIVVGVLYHLHTHTKTIPPSHLLLCLLPQHINKAAAALRHSCTELLVSFTHTHTHTHSHIHSYTLIHTSKVWHHINLFRCMSHPPTNLGWFHSKSNLK